MKLLEGLRLRTTGVGGEITLTDDKGETIDGIRSLAYRLAPDGSGIGVLYIPILTIEIEVKDSGLEIKL